MVIALLPLHPHRRPNLGALKGELAAWIDADLDRVAIAEVALQQLERQLVLDALLDHALERPCPEDRVVALLGQLRARGGRQLQRDMARAEQLAQPAKLDLDDLPNVRAAERLEDDRVVNSVQELGPEFFANLFQHACLDHLLAFAALG